MEPCGDLERKSPHGSWLHFVLKLLNLAASIVLKIAHFELICKAPVNGLLAANNAF